LVGEVGSDAAWEGAEGDPTIPLPAARAGMAPPEVSGLRVGRAWGSSGASGDGGVRMSGHGGVAGGAWALAQPDEGAKLDGAVGPTRVSGVGSLRDGAGEMTSAVG